MVEKEDLRWEWSMFIPSVQLNKTPSTSDSHENCSSASKESSQTQGCKGVRHDGHENIFDQKEREREHSKANVNHILYLQKYNKRNFGTIRLPYCTWMRLPSSSSTLLHPLGFTPLYDLHINRSTAFELGSKLWQGEQPYTHLPLIYTVGLPGLVDDITIWREY